MMHICVYRLYLAKQPMNGRYNDH